MIIERTLVLIKPDAVKRSLIGPVLTKLQEAKLILIASRYLMVSEELAKEHYAAHVEKPFFPELLDYITGKLHGSPNNGALALVYEGENAIKAIRALAGATNPEKADPQSIRGMFGRVTTKGVMENVVHASATPIEAEREIKLWFTPDQILHDIYPAKQNGTKRTWERIPAASEI